MRDILVGVIVLATVISGAFGVYFLIGLADLVTFWSRSMAITAEIHETREVTRRGGGGESGTWTAVVPEVVYTPPGGMPKRLTGDGKRDGYRTINSRLLLRYDRGANRGLLEEDLVARIGHKLSWFGLMLGATAAGIALIWLFVARPF